jgi:hypothetical protein
MTTNISPSPAIMAKAWHDLKCEDCGYPTRKAFLEKMNGDTLHYYPLIIYSNENIEALIYFDRYDAGLGTCNAHFITGKKMKNPRNVLREAKKAMAGIMANGDIKLLFAFIPHERYRAVQVAQHIGFVPFYINAEYTVLSL